MRLLRRRRVSRTDAPTLGMVDMLKRRRVSPSKTQRQADIEDAARTGAWSPAPQLDGDGRPTTRDRTGVNPLRIVTDREA